MQYISYNTAGRDFPDIYALALGRCAPSGIVRIYLANPSLLCYNLYKYNALFKIYLMYVLQCPNEWGTYYALMNVGYAHTI